MRVVLVTGGGGFVGSAIVRMLVKQGITTRVVGRNQYKNLEQLGVTCLVGDIANKDFVEKSCRGVDTVIHTAAKAGIWGMWDEYYRTNVVGTKNIVETCRKLEIPRLVYTSTPSVVFNGLDIEGENEHLPYPRRFLCHYSKSKVMAEKIVLAATSSTLRTCAIRPHLIWGPADPHLIPRLIERGKARALKIVGSGKNFVDITFIENVAHAHILAAKSINNSAVAAGNPYFIGQERPVNLWNWINDLYQELGIPVITARIPFRLAYTIGAMLEVVYLLLKKSQEPPMTRFLAEQLSCNHYFSHDNAAHDLGYKPIVSLEEGQEQLLNWLTIVT